MCVIVLSIMLFGVWINGLLEFTSYFQTNRDKKLEFGERRGYVKLFFQSNNLMCHNPSRHGDL